MDVRHRHPTQGSPRHHRSMRPHHPPRRLNTHIPAQRPQMITTPIIIAETLAIIILAVALAHNPNQ
nr:MAG TPA: hypothetical protein [Caudoviricetes sp.]